MSTDDDIAFDPDESGTTLGDEARTALADVEELPLAERAPAYDALAARLREELEQSDPARGPRQ